MSKREQQKTVRKESIVLAAKGLFLAHGIQAVQLQDIARDAGLGIATLYRYFPNKDQLVIAVSNLITQQMIDALSEIKASERAAFDKLEAMLDYYIEFSTDPEHHFLKFFKAFEYYKPTAQVNEENAEYRAIRKQLADLLLSLVEEGKADGSLRTEVDLDLYMITVIHNISYFTTESTLARHDPTLGVDLSPHRQLTLLKDMFLAYVRPFH